MMHLHCFWPSVLNCHDIRGVLTEVMAKTKKVAELVRKDLRLCAMLRGMAAAGLVPWPDPYSRKDHATALVKIDAFDSAGRHTLRIGQKWNLLINERPVVLVTPVRDGRLYTEYTAVVVLGDVPH